MAKMTAADWRQIDAGIWHQSVPWGHWEISFFSDRNGNQMFEVSAYDTRSSELILDRTDPVFRTLESARSYAETSMPSAPLHRAA